MGSEAAEISMAGNVAPPGSWRDPGSHYLKAMDSDWYRGLLALQDGFVRSTMEFWTGRSVRFGALPLTTGSISSPMGLGSDSLPVSVDMFGVPTYLADSMQFGLEYLCRMHPAGAYYCMPSFRGEPTDATHLSQFFHSEAELPGGLDDVMDAVEAYVRGLVADLANAHEDVIRSVVTRPTHLEALLSHEKPFRRLTFDEACEVLGDSREFVRVDAHRRWRSLTRAGEQALIEQYGDFVWVTHWDHLAVPFYQAMEPTGRALNADLLFGLGEVVGAGERHVEPQDVMSALDDHGVPLGPYQWYVSMKREMPMRTSGFGLGVERFLMWLLQQDDIRDFQLLLRENGRDIVP